MTASEFLIAEGADEQPEAPAGDGAYDGLFARAGALQVGGVALSATDGIQTLREKLARIVLDGMYQFVGLLDAEGTTLEINRAALDGAGIRLADIVGRPFWRARWFQVSEEAEAAQRDYVRRARGGEFVRCDMEIFGEAAGDRTIVVDFSLLPIRDQSGEVVFLLAEGRNITEKKRVEAELARKNDELQGLLDQIRQLDQLKSDLFANVSHELRTPIALILGPASEMLETGDNLTDGQRRQLGVIQRNASALLKHVNDLLDLAKLDARKMTLRYSRLNLAALVRAAAEQFHAVAPTRSIAYRVSTPEVLMAEVDAETVERVLLNLLSNAFKFTPAGGHVRCALEAVAGDRALLSVQDSGPGVAPAMRQAVFERFRQLQQGTTREFGGTGLGLAIAKEFIDLHGGSIGVTSAPGTGALFQVELPLHAPAGSFVATGSPGEAEVPGVAVAGALAELQADVPDAEGTAAERPAASDRAGDDLASRPSVLVAEDNADMRRFIGDTLGGDFRVLSVGDGQAALDRAMREPPDLVITDLMMPKLGGDHLVERIRGMPATAEVPVLVLSAKDDAALRSRLLAHSVQDYVTKPFSANELRARARNLVAMKRARDALRHELASQSDDLAELSGRFIASRQALHESELRWWTIYEHSPVGIAVAEASGHIRTANPAFRSMLGLSAEEMRRCDLQRITPVEDRAATTARIARLAAGELTEYHVQRRFQRKDGALVWANTSVSIIPGSEPAGPLLVVVAEDVTEQRLAEQALIRTQDELARVARVTTLGELAASIAHEVNQPLAAIVANGHACERWLDASPPNESEAREAVQRIVRDANRAGGVIKRIRHFLRRTEQAREPVDVNELAGDVLALVGHEAANLRVSVRCELAPSLRPVPGDRIQLQQVLLNLVMNALESTSHVAAGARRVDVSTRLQQGLQGQEGDTVRVDVRDNGIGIEAADRDRVFDAFHTTKPQGMGMGLAISRGIIESHGGRLWCAPHDGPGVTFSFTLPCAAPAAEEQ